MTVLDMEEACKSLGIDLDAYHTGTDKFDDIMFKCNYDLGKTFERFADEATELEFIAFVKWGRWGKKIS